MYKIITVFSERDNRPLQVQASAPSCSQMIGHVFVIPRVDEISHQELDSDADQASRRRQ